jgi:bisphosphoglycerate-dependent phosphoglycerate mutase
MEAEQAARQLSTYFYDIDACFTSTLDRAKATTRACLDGLSKQQQPRKVIEDFRLSERHYGKYSAVHAVQRVNSSYILYCSVFALQVVYCSILQPTNKQTND